MGAGKTSVGRALAQQLHWIFEDLDDRITCREGRSVAEIFRDSGETAFRRAEHQALRHLLDELQTGDPHIIALGGGAFAQNQNADLLATSGMPTIFLDAPVDQLWQRCCDQAAANGAERPLLRSFGDFRQLYESRRPSYLKASHSIRAAGRSVDRIAADIVKKLGLIPTRKPHPQGEIL